MEIIIEDEFVGKEYIYRMVKTKFDSEEFGLTDVFGIQISAFDGSRTETVPDISVDDEAIRDLCKTCADLELDPIHLQDIARDYLDESEDVLIGKRFRL